MHDAQTERHPMEHLLEIARSAVLAAVAGRPAPRLDPRDHPEAAPAGDAFVTLTDDGRLRGCMGTLGAGLPVGDAVVRAAGLAATDDPRFPAVAARELGRLAIEVSVLTPQRTLVEPQAFVAGRDGIVVEARGRRALLLPQIATEMGWGSEQMLDAVCEKAGLRAAAWRDADTRLWTFEAERADGPLVVGGPSPAA